MDGQWVVGFLSGYGLRESSVGGFDPLKGMDAEGVWGWIDNYCRERPTAKIWEASLAFVNARRK